MRQNTQNLVSLVIGIGVCLALFLFFVTAHWVGFGVKDECRRAQSEYAGDCVHALIRSMNDLDQATRDRNAAVWALGQLGDKRALPALKIHYTGFEPGQKCEHDEKLCQYEIQKAIRLLEGGPNITAFVWR